VFLVILGGAVTGAAGEQQCCQRGQGMGQGMGGPGGDASHAKDMQVFHYLFANRDKIRRDVTLLPTGIETVTESDDPAVVEQLKGHVAAMIARMEQGRPIHARDPLFAELFRNAKHVSVRVEPLPAGVRVTEVSHDEYTVKLLHEHARVVTLFLENGMREMHRQHPVPPR
jgi:hypothetical protein